MEMIQQKLAWALAMAAMLILVYKLDLHRTGVAKSAIHKVKAGLILNLAGAGACIIFRIVIASGAYPHSTLIVLVETLGSYVLGWTLVIWGLIQGLGSFFDSKGRLKTDIAVGKLSKILSSSLFGGSGPNRIMEEAAEDVLRVLTADGVTLHRVDEAGQLRLSYSAGLTPGARNLIRMPEKTENIYHACMTSGRPVIADNPFEMMLGRRLELSKGLARAALCFPTSLAGSVHGIMAVYRAAAVAFSDDDCEILRIVAGGLGLALWRQYSDNVDRIQTRYKEAVSLAGRYFASEKSLESAMIKTAKLVHGHVPFEKIGLEIMSDGRPHFLEFNLSTGGVVSIGTGYFSGMDNHAQDLGTGSSPEINLKPNGASLNAAENDYRFPVYDGDEKTAELTIEMASAAGESDSLSMLGTALCREISEFLRREKLAASAERSSQRLGAIGFLTERAESGEDLSGFLEKAASAVIDLTPATICRIVFSENRLGTLKSAALAQVRDLEWPNSDLSGLQFHDIDFCREAFDSGTAVSFNSGNADQVGLVQPYSSLLPPEVRRGMCLPLTMGKQPTGFLIVGDVRRRSRSGVAAEDMAFVSAVAGLISMIMTALREKPEQRSQGSRAGKLTLKKTGTVRESPMESVALSSRSRINGPLASILASCEYLQNCPSGDVSEIGRFIEIIQRNAARIHSLTSEMNGI